MTGKKDMVYICSPLSAPDKRQLLENMRKARKYAKAVSDYSIWMTIYQKNENWGWILAFPF